MRVADPIPELKQRAAERIAERIRGWSALDAAMQMGIDTRRVCDIRAGRLERFSLDALIRFLARLRAKIEIEVDGVPL